MARYKHSTPEIMELLQQDIDAITSNSALNFENMVEQLDIAENDFAATIKTGMDEISSFFHQNKELSIEDKVNRLRDINAKAEELKSEDISLSVAVFLKMIDCHYLAKIFHYQNVLLDASNVFKDTRTELIARNSANEAIHKNAVNNGSDGGRSTHEKADPVIFKTLDEWKNNHQEKNNTKAGRDLFDFVNKQIELQNKTIGEHNKLKNQYITPIPEIANPNTISKWISTLKKVSNNEQLAKNDRACINFYFHQYFSKDISYSD